MAVPGVQYLILDGLRYGVARDGRHVRGIQLSESTQLKAKRPESPFLDAEVESFLGGVQSAQMDDAATWVRSALGLEPTSASGEAPYALLKVGKALDAKYSNAGAGVLRQLVADDGYLLAGEQGASDTVLNSADGTTWTAVSTGSGSTAGVSALGSWNGYALVGFPDVVDPWFSDDHGATWAVDAITNSGPLGLTGTALILAVGCANDGSAHPVRWLVISTTSGRCTGSTMTIDMSVGGSGVAFKLAEPTATAGCTDGSTAYICGADTTNPIRGQLYSWQYQADVTFLAPLDGNYATAAAAYKGKTYWGCFARGELYELSGTSLELIKTFSTTLPIRGMTVHQGALWVLVLNDAAGRLELHRYDGAWSMPSYVTATLTAAGGLAAFSTVLYAAAGDGAGPTRKAYAVSGSNRCTAAQLITPDATYGAPTESKRFREVKAKHSALLAGQAVALSYSLDGAGWVSLGTNKRVGSRETVFGLGDGVIGGRLALKIDLTNGAAQDLYPYGAKIRAVAAPLDREVWESDLILHPVSGFAWADSVADTADDLVKWEFLKALARQRKTFQAVDVARDANGMPRRAMLALIDPERPMEAQLESLMKGTDLQARLPLRLLQAAPPANLLDNASFEQDTAGSHPTSWGLSGSATAWQTDALAGAPDGSRVLTITYDGVAANPSVAQAVTVTPGRYYTLSGWLRRLALSGGSAALYLRVSEAGVVIPGAETTHLAAGSDAGFTKYSVTFLVPTSSGGTVAVEIFASGTPGGGLYADAIQLEEGSPASDFRERGA